MPIEIKVVRTRSGIRNAHTRMPFRFGVITMRAAPLLTLAVEIEDRRGARATGYAADFLAYRWFDKRPEKSLADNCADLLRAVEAARALYLEAGEEGLASPFELWRATYPEIERRALASGCNRLGAAFGSSMLERAVIDGVGRLTGRSYFELVRDDHLGIDLGAITPELQGRAVREFLPAQPLGRLHVRHTVGLIDPITAADVREPVADGLPETLEDYLERDGIRYLKIKVGGAPEADLARLEAIARGARAARAALWHHAGRQRAVQDARRLHGAGRADQGGARAAAPVGPGPVHRAAARSRGRHGAGRRAGAARARPRQAGDHRRGRRPGQRVQGGHSARLSRRLAQELQGHLQVAAQPGARGGCTTPAAGRAELFLSAEDLSNLPVVPLQADLASVALLGITHVERNGHHYFRGLGHLSEAEKAAALAAHPDLYERRGGEVFLRITEGTLECASLQVPGMGFAAPPDMAAMTPVEDWDFASLGQEE